MNVLLLFVIISIIVVLFYKKNEPFKNQHELQIYLINLKKAKERLVYCTRIFNKYNLKFKIIQGIDGNDYKNVKEMVNVNDFCLNGTKHAGCYLSHLKAIREFYESDYKYGLILEDDFKFIENPVKHLEKYLKLFNNDEIDVVILVTENYTKKLEEVHKLPTYNATAYMLNKKSAKMILDNLTPGSNFLKKYNRDCLYDFVLYDLISKLSIRYKWFTLVHQNPKLNSQINDKYINISGYILNIYTGTVNFGDICSKDLLERLTNLKFADKSLKSISAVGSILQDIPKNTIVWGTGFISEKSTLLNKPEKIFLVRGPKTYKKLLNLGIDCPKNFGDPFFIAPLFYNSFPTKIYKKGIINHHSIKNDNDNNYNNFYYINIQTEDAQKFIDDVTKCEIIYSSSLHGIIIALAYDIPTVWINLIDTFKFYDFFESLNMYDVKPNEIITIPKINKLNSGLVIINSCPFITDDRKKILLNKWNDFIINNNWF